MQRLVIWVLIACFGVCGCSGESKTKREQLVQKVQEWKNAEHRLVRLLGRPEEAGVDSFEDKYLEGLSGMQTAQEEFSRLTKRIDDANLKKDAKLCEDGMKEVRMAVWTYGTYVQLYLERRKSGATYLIKEAKAKQNEERAGFTKSRREGLALIESSGL